VRLISKDVKEKEQVITHYILYFTPNKFALRVNQDTPRYVNKSSKERLSISGIFNNRKDLTDIIFPEFCVFLKCR
jgi:hypothetical protein